MSFTRYAVRILMVLGLVQFTACGGGSGSTPEIPVSEVTAEVAELDAVHELMYPLWHDAFPNKDYDTIRELVPQFEPLLAAVEEVQLPGILRDKQARWDEGKARMMASFESLKQAAEAHDHDGMLQHTEAFHMRYEGLVRVIRPVVPELEAFHQELYKLYHYSSPAYDVARIGEAVAAMAERVEPLREATLPSRLAERQGEFAAGVTVLGEKVEALRQALETGDEETVKAAVEAVHSAYESVEKVFG